MLHAPTTDEAAATGRVRTLAHRPRRPVPPMVVGVVLVALVVAPMVVAGLTALGREWHPTGDWAVLSLRVEDVGGLTPMVGPYSRYGWNHPGPLLYWVLAGPYHLLGDRPESLLAATALLNAAAVAGAVAMAWRRGGALLATILAAGLAVVSHSLGPELLRDPWNPYVTVLAVATFVLAAWSLAEGDHWSWPVALGVGSFLVQSHVGYAVTVGAVGVVALVLAWARRRTTPFVPVDLRTRRLVVGVTVAVAVVSWLPVALDQVAGSGNVGEIVRYFASSDEQPAGVGVGLGHAARQLAIPDAPWLGDPEEAGSDGALLGGQPGDLLVPVGAFALAVAAAAAARRWDAVRLQALVAVLAVSGVVATARVTGPVYAYLVRWWWVVACLWWVSCAWSAVVAVLAWRRLPGRARSALPWVVGAVGLLVLVGASGPTARDGFDAETPDAAATAVLDDLLAPTVEAARGAGPVLVEPTGSVWGTVADAVRFELERGGVPVAVPPRDAYRFGEGRSSDRRPPSATVWVVSADAATEWRARAELPLVAAWDPLTPDERAAFVADERVLLRQLRAAGRDDLADAVQTGGGGLDTGSPPPGVDPELLRRVEETRRRGDPVAVFLGPATDPNDPRPPWEPSSSSN